MVDFILQNWVVLLGGGSLTGIIGWFLGGRDKTHIELRKNNADATVTIQGMYETFAVRYDSQYKEVLFEVAGLKKQVCDLDLRNAVLTEASANSEKQVKRLELELELKSNEIIELRKESDSRGEKLGSLQKEHDLLKKAFDSLKKSMK